MVTVTEEPAMRKLLLVLLLLVVAIGGSAWFVIGRSAPRRKQASADDH